MKFVRANEKTKLVSGRSCGRVAKDIYEECCASFGWDACKSAEFGNCRPLYARGAADYGKRAVIFICHSNWYRDILIPVTDANGKAGKQHRNYIHDGCQRIEEYQQNAQSDVYPLQDRITFAKNRNGEYIFLGVYRSDEPDSRNCRRTFTQISTEYTASK